MLKKGFTLVELLIVIGLLGAIALIVIAAINPIEQANRARDTRFKADGGQLISAVERYFAVKSEFPWVTGGTAVNDDPFGFITAQDPTVGVCGTSCTATDGNLLEALELKSEFLNRDFIKTADVATEYMYVGKSDGASSSVYACYVPMSKSNRDKACEDDKVYTLGAADGIRTSVTCAAGDDWNVATPSVVCIPE